MGRFAEWLRRVLHARSPDEMEGITISGPCWEVSDKGLDHAAFFRALPMLVGEGATLVVEGGSHPPELRTLLEGHFRAWAIEGSLGDGVATRNRVSRARLPDCRCCPGRRM